MEVSQVAAAALAMLDEHGWAQGTCEDGEGRICLGTALCLAAGLPLDGKLTPAQATAWIALTDAVLAAIPDPFSPADAVPKFNDYSSREDVRLVLETILAKETDILLS